MHPLLHALSYWNKYGKAQIYVQKRCSKNVQGLKVSKKYNSKKNYDRSWIQTQYLSISKSHAPTA